MGTGLGYQSFVGLAKEGTWGTYVAPTADYAEFNSDSIDAVEDRIHISALRDVVNRVGNVSRGGVSVEGDMELDWKHHTAATNDLRLKIIEQALGTVATTSPDITNQQNAKQHVFTIADALPEGLSLEVYRGTLTTDESFQYEGIKINTLAFSCGLDEIVKMVFGVLGEDVNMSTKSTVAIPVGELASYDQVTAEYGGNAISIESFEVSLDNGLDADRKFLGSRLRSEPIRGSKMDVTAMIRIEFDSDDQYDDFRAMTSKALMVKATSPTEIDTGQANYYKIQFDLAVAKLVHAVPFVTSEGRVVYDVTFKGYSADDKATKDLKITCLDKVTTV